MRERDIERKRGMKQKRNLSPSRDGVRIQSARGALQKEETEFRECLWSKSVCERERNRKRERERVRVCERERDENVVEKVYEDISSESR